MDHRTSCRTSTSATIEATQAWSSVVLQDTLTLEHAAVDINTERILYHLHLELEHPIPELFLANAEFLTLSWPIGGIWKIMSLSQNNHHVHCTSWRETEMNPEEVSELANKVALTRSSPDPAKNHYSPADDEDTGDLTPTVFNWKMQLGQWGTTQHWFLRDIMPPQNGRPGPLTVQLLAGFSPLEVQIEVNAITAVDTVGQTFTADVTWEVTLPAITTIREDSMLSELTAILEIEGEQFEFTNVNSVQEKYDLYYGLLPAGPVNFTDRTSLATPVEPNTESLSHVLISRRIVATFSEEMTVYSFPVDQQKLTFSFSTGLGLRESLRITPAPLDAGTFAIDNYKMGNVFDVVYHDKIFVGEIDAKGTKKGIRFEMMLERRPGYYVTNVAILAAVITYLCFISYAPLADGKLVETGDRLQIVLTLLLTAVTFKNQVGSLIPRISYFTTLDKYVFFCFMIACLVVVETALFPVVAKSLKVEKSWKEKSLLWFSIGFFTFVNVAWGIYIVLFVKYRKRESKVLLNVHEAIRVIATSGIPAEHREAVLHEYLEECHFQNWELPEICCAEFGYLYVRLPDDEPQCTDNIDKKKKLHASTRQNTEQKLDFFRNIYTKLNPSGSPLRALTRESQMPLRATKPSEAFQDGRGQILRLSGVSPSSPAAATLTRSHSVAVYHRMT
ncbi:hypothetical protein L917_18129 [Phytophthora nicotianae]|uniref:Neurotransmitter-gated ion-channel transmembrane domain-containing protein n=1 Tax=Phytophthora nicotianae TaxID=4792 RepID=W2K8V6_PHYNI|nr:hypothetical protein L917_18129 [Phytophthora nicotianae]